MFKIREDCSKVLAAIVLFTTPIHSQAAVFFEDNFDGATVDSTRWRTEHLVAGMRWCDVNAGSAAGPGGWVNPESESCFGITQAPPFGTALPESGLLRLSAIHGSRAFPFLTSRIPDAPELFPVDGDFVLTIRLRYDHGGAWGDGIVIHRRNSTAPGGTVAPVNASDILLQIWADPSISLSSSITGANERIPTSIANPDQFHEYSVRGVASSYDIFVDGVRVYGPTRSDLRPNAIWLGNPVFSYWGPGGWSNFSVDFIRVEAAGVTSAATRSWGALKIDYR